MQGRPVQMLPQSRWCELSCCWTAESWQGFSISPARHGAVPLQKDPCLSSLLFLGSLCIYHGKGE